MSVEDVENFLGEGCKSYTIWWYKPEGVVKEIHCHGTELRFEDDKLEGITYKQDFNFEVALTPFSNRLMNPPLDTVFKIHYGMRKEKLPEVIKKWKSILVNSGYKDVDKSSLESKEFDDEGWGSWVESDISYTLSFGLTPQGLSGVYHPHALWKFIFTKDGFLKEILATNTEYSLDWVFKKE